MDKVKTNTAYVLDDTDWKIVSELLRNSRISLTEIGTNVGLSRVAVKTRIDAMCDAGIIERFTVIMNWDSVILD